LLHLQGLSCLAIDNITGRDLYPTLTGEYPAGLTSEFEALQALVGPELAAQVIGWWQPKLLTSVTLTTVGVAIGAAVANVLTGQSIDLAMLLSDEPQQQADLG